MKIAMFGYSVTGVEVAKHLTKKDLTIFVFDEKELKKAKDNSYFNVELLDELTDDNLEKIEFSNFDVAISILEDEASNLFLSLSIKTIAPNINLISIVKDSEYENRYKLAGVDEIVNIYKISSQHMHHIITKPLAFGVLISILFENNSLIFGEIVVLEKSFLDNKSMKEINEELKKEYNLIIIGILDTERSDKFEFITKGYNHHIDTNDILVLLGDDFEIKRLKEDMEESVKWQI